MSSNAAQWASIVIAAMKSEGLTTDRKIGDAGGPSDTTMTMYRNAIRGVRHGFPEPRDDTFDRIDKVCKWAPGEARKLWADIEHEPVGVRTQDAGYVSSPGAVAERTESDSDVLRRLDAMEETLRQVQSALERLREN